jgi:hypothetical protein
MSFLAPAFLAGLLALAIPVLIHLIQRERKQIVEFPSLMFLRKIPYPSVRRRRIHNWLLLAVRLAALALIVTAFARPFVSGAQSAAAAAGGAREVVILLDRSYSMGYGDRWSRAVAEARRVVDGLARDDRATLVTFATGAEARVRSSSEKETLRAEIDRAAVGSGATKLGPALKLAQSVLAQSRLPRREVVLISDFQRHAWDRSESLRLPEGGTLNPISVAEPETTNVAVTGVNLQRTVAAGQDRSIVTGALMNRGAAPVSGLEVALEIDGRVVQTGRVDLQPNASGSMTFQPVTVTATGTRAIVRAASDRLEVDNAFHFVLSPAEAVSVLLVGRSGAARDASLYLTRALAIGSAPAFAVESTSLERVGSDPAARVVILNDVPVPAGALRTFVEGGGGLLIVTGERTGTHADAGALLPGTIGDVVDRSRGTGATMGALDYSHPAFELFKAPRSGDFSAARFFHYRSVSLTPDARALARFDDGAVALAERRAGAGRVMLWTTTLDAFWNDLALKPVFLPFIHQVVRYLARYEEPRAWHTVGQVVDARGPRARSVAADSLLALDPAGQRIALGGASGAALELAERGFYEVRPSAGEGGPTAVIAANPDVAESDLTTFDPKELVLAVASGAGAGAGVEGGAELTPEQVERRQALWWYLLFAGVVLLLLEQAVSAWTRAGTPVAPSGGAP